MIVWICTDMEGLSGVDNWNQCYDPDDNSSDYRHGLVQLNMDVNAAVAGCFDAGATSVRVADGHGRNNNRGFIDGLIDPRIEKVWISRYDPLRMESLNETVDCVAMIGQHSMAGTIGGFIDHTQVPKILCSYKINGVKYGEMGQFALYAGYYGIPLVYVSGDEALCGEAKSQFPWTVSTPTKKGLGWAHCELYSPDRVRDNIRRDIAAAVKSFAEARVWQPEPPINIEVEWAYSEFADNYEQIPGVRRIDAHTVAWTIDDARDIYSWPSLAWQPKHTP